MRVSGIRHPALASGGSELNPSAVLEQDRLALLAQGGSLLAFLRVAGWRLAAPWSSARVQGDQLSGLRAVQGVEPNPGKQLVRWTEFLFDAIAPPGRSRVRRVVRELAERWLSLPVGWAIEDWLSDLMARAPELERVEAVTRSFRGEFRQGASWTVWEFTRPGERASDSEPASGPPSQSSRSMLAPAESAAPRRRTESARIQLARELERVGRLEAALASLEGERGPSAEQLRFTIQLQLGLLGPARYTLRRLEARALEPSQKLAITDEVLRLWAALGERGRAREWMALLLKDCRGDLRCEAELYAIFERLDAGELVGLEQRLTRLEARAARRPRTRRLWLEAAAELAFARSDGESLVRFSTALLREQRRSMTRIRAGRAWNRLGLGRDLLGDLAGAERAYSRAMKLLARADGPLRITLAASNWAEVRLRQGFLEGVEEVLGTSERENLRSGNAVGLLYDRLLRLRLQLVRGELGAVFEASKRLVQEGARLGLRQALQGASILGARACGWLGEVTAGRELLAPATETWYSELEPEEVPFLRAQLEHSDLPDPRPLAQAAAALAASVRRGDTPSEKSLAWLFQLEPYRRARVVFDAERLLPGVMPPALREEAEQIFNRVGATTFASSLRRLDQGAWEMLADYLAGNSESSGALGPLLAAVGHAGAKVVWKRPGGERILFDGGSATAGASTLILRAGGDELHLQSGRVDGPLRAIGALLVREVTSSSSGSSEPVGASPFVGQSAALKAALERLTRFARSDMPVLLLGENGTGKELAARWVHECSLRRHQPFVPFNCAGLTETLQHSELFGHVRGAFTGADRARSGVFEQAHGGTLLLDEIGDLPHSAQGAILRALQEGEIRRVGESLPRRVDVRLLAATHRDLEQMLEEERFRQDLFYRLKVAVVRLPPLRERREDIPLLAEAFLTRMRVRAPNVKLSAKASRLLLEHSWPGNIRELRHALEAAALLAEGGTIEPRHLDLDRGPVAESAGTLYHASLELTRKRLLEEALEAAGGNQAAAARKLGISRQNFSYLARRYGLTRR